MSNNDLERKRIEAHIGEARTKQLINYVSKGVVPEDDMLYHALRNDLKGVFQSADMQELLILPMLMAFLYNYVPMVAWGSPELVEDWVKRQNPH